MKDLLRLALPVSLTFLGYMTMNLVDLVFLGRVSPVALGATGAGQSLFQWFFTFGIGILSALEFTVSHAFGKGDLQRGRIDLHQGLWMALIYGILGTLALLWINEHLDFFGISQELLIPTQRYLVVLSLSLAPALIYVAYRNYLQSLGHVVVPFIFLGAANVLNAIFNYVLIFGHFGFPRLEEQGAAWATTLSRVWMLLSIIIYTWRISGEWPWGRWVASRARALFRLGLPSGSQMLLEVGVFALSTTLAAGLGSVAIATHQIVLNAASIIFMIPLGISSSAAVLVGRAWGRGHHRHGMKTGWNALLLGAIINLSAALCFYFFPDAILSFYLSKPDIPSPNYTVYEETLALGRDLMFLVALFQLSDGAQSILTGALRGTGNTVWAMKANFVGHWIIGFPLGLWLCFGRNQGLFGIWTGLALGLTCVAVTLLVLWSKQSKLHLRA